MIRALQGLAGGRVVDLLVRVSTACGWDPGVSDSIHVRSIGTLSARGSAGSRTAGTRKLHRSADLMERNLDRRWKR
jgi:polyphosphate kinase